MNSRDNSHREPVDPDLSEMDVIMSRMRSQPDRVLLLADATPRRNNRPHCELFKKNKQPQEKSHIKSIASAVQQMMIDTPQKTLSVSEVSKHMEKMNINNSEGEKESQTPPRMGNK